MLKRLWRTDAPLTVTGILMLPALAMAAVGLLVDPRLITGAPAWLKPAKFALSIAVYVFTLAWMFTSIPGFRRTRRIVYGFCTNHLCLNGNSLFLNRFCGSAVNHSEPARVAGNATFWVLIPFARGNHRAQFLLGHVSVATTERYLGCKQRLRFA